LVLVVRQHLAVVGLRVAVDLTVFFRRSFLSAAAAVVVSIVSQDLRVAAVVVVRGVVALQPAVEVGLLIKVLLLAVDLPTALEAVGVRVESVVLEQQTMVVMVG